MFPKLILLNVSKFSSKLSELILKPLQIGFFCKGFQYRQVARVKWLGPRGCGFECCTYYNKENAEIKAAKWGTPKKLFDKFII